MPVTFIGDVHGKIYNYLALTESSEYTVQVGDMGFNYRHLTKVDAAKHRVLAGNHDNYTKQWDTFTAMQSAHWLGDYGAAPLNGLDFFFVRGGHSIDWRTRRPNIDYWIEEELPLQKMMEAKDIYAFCKPRVVVTHECPASIIRDFFGQFTYETNIIRPSNTATFLQILLEIHRPDLWIFGHFHERKDEIIGGTRFVCLEELGTLEVAS